MSADVHVELGNVVSTPGALAALEEADAPYERYLSRHQKGDWGSTLDPEDQAANQQALEVGSRLLSRYVLSTGAIIWIITEADRSSTTILPPLGAP